jgi:hypothetical protein
MASALGGAAGLLTLINGDVSLMLQIGSVAVPIIKGLVGDIRAITNPQGVVEYTVVIKSDKAELAAIAQVAIADLMEINRQLKGEGAATLDVPRSSQ